MFPAQFVHDPVAIAPSTTLFPRPRPDSMWRYATTLRIGRFVYWRAGRKTARRRDGKSVR
jgi:hypothetical protein